MEIINQVNKDRIAPEYFKLFNLFSANMKGKKFTNIFEGSQAYSGQNFFHFWILK